jgi:hypothetical protein
LCAVKQFWWRETTCSTRASFLVKYIPRIVLKRGEGKSKVVGFIYFARDVAVSSFTFQRSLFEYITKPIPFSKSSATCPWMCVFRPAHHVPTLPSLTSSPQMPPSLVAYADTPLPPHAMITTPHPESSHKLSTLISHSLPQRNAPGFPEQDICCETSSTP